MFHFLLSGQDHFFGKESILDPIFHLSKERDRRIVREERHRDGIVRTHRCFSGTKRRFLFAHFHENDTVIRGLRLQFNVVEAQRPQ